MLHYTDFLIKFCFSPELSSWLKAYPLCCLLTRFCSSLFSPSSNGAFSEVADSFMDLLVNFSSSPPQLSQSVMVCLLKV